MADIVRFTGITRLPVDPERVLEDVRGELSEVVVIGHDHEGNFVFSASEPDAASVIYLLEKAKYALMRTVERLEKGDV